MGQGSVREESIKTHEMADPWLSGILSREKHIRKVSPEKGACSGA